MNWLKRIFCSQEEFNVHANGLPEVSIEIQMPKVKPCKPEKNISEPVISFVECVRNNPKRFDVAEDTGDICFGGRDNPEDRKAYKLWDKVAKKGWYIKRKHHFNFRFICGYGDSDDHYYSEPFFLTEDEKSYIIKEVKSVMYYRIERKDRLDQIRAERRIRDERNRLKAIYCK